MKVIKEDIVNLEKCIENDKVNIVGSMPITMADAFYDSQKKQKQIDDAMKETIEENKDEKVIGAKKQPVPKKPEEPKATLEESLFEDYDSDIRHYSDMLFDMIEEGVVDAAEIAKDLIYWCSEDDIEHYMRVNDLMWEEDEDESLEESYTKAELLNAVQDHFGFNKKESQNWIKNASDKSKDEIVKFFKANAKKNFYESLKEAYDTDIVAEILSGSISKPKSTKVFKYLSNNGDSGEVKYRGIDYSFRKLKDGSYKVMRSTDAGSNWSETLFKDENLKEARGRKTKPFVDQRTGEIYTDEDRGEGFDNISDDDLFNIVSAELCPEDSNWYRKTKIPEIPQWRRYNSENMGVDGDGNLFVRTKSEDDLVLAKRIAEVYGLQTSGPYKSSAGYKFTLIIPEE